MRATRETDKLNGKPPRSELRHKYRVAHGMPYNGYCLGLKVTSKLHDGVEPELTATTYCSMKYY